MGKSTRWVWSSGLVLMMLLSTGFMCNMGSIFSSANQSNPDQTLAETPNAIATPNLTDTPTITASIPPTENNPVTLPESSQNPLTTSVGTTAAMTTITSADPTASGTISPNVTNLEIDEALPKEIDSPVIDSPKPVFAMQYVPVEDLALVSGLGTNVVLQNFRNFEAPEEWLAYLDAAHSYDMQVIAWYWEPGWTLDRTTDEWIIDENAILFLQTVRSHPALFAVYVVHEPYWNGCDECGYTTPQLQALYSQIKAVADVPLYAALGGLADWVDQNEAKEFADGICDYCDLWYYPFREGGVYNIEKTISVIEKEIGFAREKAPNSKIIWAMQAFEQGAPENNVRMWNEEEIRHLAELVYAADIYGISWYTWQFGDLYSDFLANHPELFPVVKEIADQYKSGALPTNPLSLSNENNLSSTRSVSETNQIRERFEISPTTPISIPIAPANVNQGTIVQTSTDSIRINVDSTLEIRTGVTATSIYTE